MEKEVDVCLLDKDSGKRLPIWQYHVDQREKIRRFYVNNGPYQPILTKYPALGNNHFRRFQSSWFKKFPSWLDSQLKRIQHFVYHAICLVIILGVKMMEKMHLQIRDFGPREKSMEGIVPFLVTWDLHLIHHIMLVLSVVMICCFNPNI